MGKIIKTGSITKNPTDLLQGTSTDSVEDRSSFFRSDNVVTWDTTGTPELKFTGSIVLDVLNTAGGGAKTTHEIDAGSTGVDAGPVIVFPSDGSIAHILIDRTTNETSLTVTVATSISAQILANKDVIVLGTRVDAGGNSYLHLPWAGQTLAPNEIIRLGGSGSTQALDRQNAFFDAIVGTAGQVTAGIATHTSLQAVDDDVAIVDGDSVLYLKNSIVGPVIITKKLYIEGLGHNSEIDGALTFATSADFSSISGIRITGDITFDSGTEGILFEKCWVPSTAAITENGDNDIDFWEE